HGDVLHVADVQGLGPPVDPDSPGKRAFRHRLRPDLGIAELDARPLAHLLLDVSSEDLPAGVSPQEMISCPMRVTGIILAHARCVLLRLKGCLPILRRPAGNLPSWDSWPWA